ncbi:MAG: glycosyltransferase family 39 protein [Phycisphaerales bacterium]|nr:glycosyltransferase family 39 protein [Phycisphaerales bacterium]
MSHRTAPTRNALLLVFLAALIVRAGFCFLTISVLKLNIGPNRPDFFTSTDGYIDLAVNMVDHGVYAFAPDGPPTAYRAPLYPAVLAVAYATLGNTAWAILLVNCVASAAACVVVFTIARRLYPNHVSIWWATPIVMFPLSIYYCASSFSDTFLTLTIAMYVWALVALMQSPNARTGVGAGVAFAATALTKAVVLPIPLLVCAYAGIRQRRSLKHSIVALIVGFSLVGVWTYRNYRSTGAFVPVTGGAGFNLLLGNFMIDKGGDCDASLKFARTAAVEHLRNVEGVTIDLSQLDTDGHLDVPRSIDAEYGRAAVAMYRSHPTLLARKLAINCARFWYFSSSPLKSLANGVVNLAILASAIIGWRRMRRTDRSAAEVLALFVVSFMLLYAGVIVHSSRFSLPIVMAILPLATAPIAAAWNAYVGQRSAESAAASPAAPKTALTGAKS